MTGHEIAYGTDCMWWGPLADARVVAAHPLTPPLVCCPFCGGACSTHATEASFMELARRFEIIGFAGHRDLLRHIKGLCFKTRGEAWAHYRSSAMVMR